MKLWPLQSLRFWAALAVVHYHCVGRAAMDTGRPGLLGSFGLDLFGRAGVDVFFVISGVIIARTAPGLTASEFAVKRLRRILPVYLFLSLPWLLIKAEIQMITWRGLVATFLLWPVTDRMAEPVNPVAWSLCYEMLFYACAALVLWRRWMLPVLLGGFAMALAIRQGPLLEYLGSPLSIEFLFGVALAYAPRFEPLKWATLLGFAILLLDPHLGWAVLSSKDAFDAGMHSWLRVVAIGLPAAAIVAGALQFEGRPGLTTYLGDASYSLYLVHPLVLFCLFTPLQISRVSLPPDAIILLGMSMSVLAAWRCYELFEKPVALFFKRPEVETRAMESATP